MKKDNVIHSWFHLRADESGAYAQFKRREAYAEDTTLRTWAEMAAVVKGERFDRVTIKSTPPQGNVYHRSEVVLWDVTLIEMGFDVDGATFSFRKGETMINVTACFNAGTVLVDVDME